MLNLNTVTSCIGFSGVTTVDGEVGMIDRIQIALGLEAHGVEVAIDLAALAGDGVGRRCCRHTATMQGWVVDTSITMPVCGSVIRAAGRKVPGFPLMTISSSMPLRMAICGQVGMRTSPTRTGLRKSAGVPSTGRISPVTRLPASAGVKRSAKTCMRLVGDIAIAFALQREMAVVGQVGDGRPVGRGAIFQLQRIVAGDRIGDRRGQLRRESRHRHRD